MFYRRFALLLLVLVFLVIFPGTALADDMSTQETNSSAPKNTLIIEAPGQIEAGQTLTLVARVRENEFDTPIVNAQVIFFAKSDFFIEGLMEIGEAVTDIHGLAKLDYIPNQPGALQVVASYKAGKNVAPAVDEGTVNIIGSSKSLYKTSVGIQFPNGLLFWILGIVIILFAVWSTFLYVLYQVQHISRGTGAKAVPFILIVIVAAIFTVIIMILVTPESQYNFGFLP